jgi:hypothetical protein
MVFAAEGADGVLRLWSRALNTLEPVPLPGTDVFAIIPPVVWSPDSDSSPSTLATCSRRPAWTAAHRSRYASCWYRRGRKLEPRG